MARMNEDPRDLVARGRSGMNRLLDLFQPGRSAQAVGKQTLTEALWRSKQAEVASGPAPGTEAGTGAAEAAKADAEAPAASTTADQGAAESSGGAAGPPAKGPLDPAGVKAALAFYEQYADRYSPEVIAQIASKLGDGAGASPGEAFAQAVALYQQGNGVAVDGKAGRQTLTHMFGSDIRSSGGAPASAEAVASESASPAEAPSAPASQAAASAPASQAATATAPASQPAAATPASQAAAAAPASAAEAPASTGAGSEATSAVPPAAAPAPAGPAEVRDPDLGGYLASLKSPQVDAVARQLAALQQKAQALQANLEVTEEKGVGRDELVAGIAALRQEIAKLVGAGLDPATLAEAKKRLYRAVHDLAPYYSQGRNMDLLEGKAQAAQLGTSTSVVTRTCNITSLAMALESLGKSAADYDAGKRDEVLAAAQVFKSELGEATLRVAGGGDAWGDMAGLRMSDFLQLAAIAEKLSGGKSASKSVTAAAVSAWSSILSIDFLRQLALRFGVSGTVRSFTLDPSKDEKGQAKDLAALESWGSAYRRSTETLVDARNKAESTHDAADYEKKKKGLATALSGASIEKKLPLESYKQAIWTQVGAELDGGSAVVVLLSGHYVRLQAIHEDHLIFDDPGRAERANRKVLWEEARAMGYFRHRLVLPG